MDPARYLPVFATGLIVAVTLLSGPLVGGVDFTHDRTDETVGIGTGSASVTSVSLPGTVQFQQGRYGSGGYYVRVPDATVEFERIRGRPILSYKLEVEEMGYSRETSHFLSSDTPERLALSIEKDTLDPEEVEATEYSGRLRVSVRANGTDRVLASRNVTVRVDR
jgi:hypothetical protein